MKCERTFRPGVASLLALVAASVACNALFDITEGASRHSAGDDDDSQAANGGTRPSAGVNGVPKAGTGGKGGAATGGVGQTMGGASNGGSGGATAAAGGDTNVGGATGGSNQGMGGSVAKGGAGGDAGGTGGNASGAGGIGGIGGSASGVAGSGGAEQLPIASLPTILFWPKCSEDTAQFSTTCAFYGGSGETSCPSGGAVYRETYQIGGQRGSTLVTEIAAFGAVTPHCYQGGTFVNPTAGGLIWLDGGQPTDDDGTVYELDVYEEHGTVPVQSYYLNVYRRPDNLSADIPDPACDGDIIDTARDRVILELPGQGTIDIIVRDRDCVMATNCGTASEGDLCAPYGSTFAAADAPPWPYDAVYSNYAPRDERYDHRSAAWSQFLSLTVVTTTSK